MRALFRFYGLRCRVPPFATPTDGADPRQVEAACRVAGLRVIAGEMATGDLRHFTRTGRPVVALFRWPTGAASHYGVVRGLAGGRVHLWDPAEGDQAPRLGEWEAGWADPRDPGRFGEAFRRWGLVAYPDPANRR